MTFTRNHTLQWSIPSKPQIIIYLWTNEVNRSQALWAFILLINFYSRRDWHALVLDNVNQMPRVLHEVQPCGATLINFYSRRDWHALILDNVNQMPRVLHEVQPCGATCMHSCMLTKCLAFYQNIMVGTVTVCAYSDPMWLIMWYSSNYRVCLFHTALCLDHSNSAAFKCTENHL